MEKCNTYEKINVELLLHTEIEKKQASDNNFHFLTIDTVEPSIGYNIFFKNYILNNLPCIVKNVAVSWECSAKWIEKDSINWDFLMQKYGELEAPVAECNRMTHDCSCKTIMSFRDYIQYLRSDRKDKLLYLKDWHLKLLRPNDNFYEVPLIFASDWLNEFAQDHGEDDFRFVYIGPRDSWTPLHADVYNSYSWSVNVIGKKTWILLPPGEEDKLKDSFGNFPVSFDSHKFPHVNYIEIIQEKGDAIFVPSGWYHQVVNTLDTISINHNWINACNLETVWKALQKSLSSVEKEIIEFEDSPDFISQCQLILKSVFGMDFATFVNFVCYMAKKRLEQFNKNHLTLYHKNYVLGKEHILFDLTILLKIMDSIRNHHLFFKEEITTKLNIANEQFLYLINIISKVVVD